MHALIIEQDAWVALMIEDALLDLGYTSFDVADTGEAAIPLAAARCPDLMTFDVRTGPSRGIETVRSICSGRFIPVIFVTSAGWKVDERSAGLVIVRKPFAVSDLKSAVAMAKSSAAVWPTCDQ